MKNKICFFSLMILGVLFISSSCAIKKMNNGAIIDADGNKYTSTVIGKQEWLRENMRTTRYNDGTSIPNIPDITEWRHIDAPAYIWYNNDISNKDTYGALYNWFAVDGGDLCPAGWRVASDDDWKQLEVYLGMNPEQIEGTGMRGTDEGGKLKESGTKNWISPNEGATNEYGFTVVPSGRIDINGVFVGITSGGTIWTATETSYSCAYYRHFATHSKLIGRNPLGEKKYGLAVRCIRDK